MLGFRWMTVVYVKIYFNAILANMLNHKDKWQRQWRTRNMENKIFVVSFRFLHVSSISECQTENYAHNKREVHLKLIWVSYESNKQYQPRRFLIFVGVFIYHHHQIYMSKKKKMREIMELWVSTSTKNCMNTRHLQGNDSDINRQIHAM